MNVGAKQAERWEELQFVPKRDTGWGLAKVFLRTKNPRTKASLWQPITMLSPNKMSKTKLQKDARQQNLDQELKLGVYTPQSLNLLY